MKTQANLLYVARQHYEKDGQPRVYCYGLFQIANQGPFRLSFSSDEYENLKDVRGEGELEISISAFKEQAYPKFVSFDLL